MTKPGKRKPVFVRFSAVVHSAGSCETALRDPRGFATKFYTDEGNYDIVGNKTPTASSISFRMSLSRLRCSRSSTPIWVFRPITAR